MSLTIYTMAKSLVFNVYVINIVQLLPSNCIQLLKFCSVNEYV